ncbi:MAG: hypothetical protein GX136_07030 [Clostridiales bacterium]|nr:hypothetical protein [Clostridiales bacterium]
MDIWRYNRTNEPTKPVSPPTGDTDNLIFWSVLCMAALGMLGGLAIIRPRIKNRCD